MNWRERTLGRLRRTDVEYVLLIYFFTTTCYSTVSSSLTTQKMCFPQRPPGVEVICNDTRAINQAANLNQIRSIMREVVPAFAVILGGSWRDTTRQSLPLILLGLSGELLGLLIELAGAVFWNLSAYLTALPAAACTALGSTKLLTMASFSYVTERTTAKDRSSRMSMLVITMLGSSCLSMILSGLILNSLNYSYAFLLLIGLSCIAVMLSLLLIKDPSDVPSSRQGYFQSIYRFKAVFTSSGRNNFVIWAFIISLILINSLLQAEGSISYLFYQTKFKLTPKEIGFLSGYKMTTYLVAIAVVTPILKSVLKLSEFQITSICVLFGIVTSIGMAFAQTTTQLYIFATLDFMRVSLISTLWTLFSKCLPKSEIGLYMSLQSFGDGIAPLLVSPLYVYVFNRTVAVMPGAYYLISAATILFVALIVWIISFYYKEEEESEDERRLETDEDGGKEEEVEHVLRL